MSAPQTTTYLGKRQVAEGTMEFRFARPPGLEYKAGQYCDLYLGDAGGAADKRDYWHQFSFASAPYQDEVTCAMRMRADSHFKAALQALPEGSPVRMEAPWGNFTLRRSTRRPMVFLIGGIGITPVLSMIRQATHEHTEHRLTLLYANRDRAHAAYMDELAALATANPRFKLVPTYEQEPADAEGAEHGRIDAGMVQRHVPDMHDASFYMAGPRGMVYAMRELLVSMDVDEDHIKTEEFTGY